MVWFLGACARPSKRACTYDECAHTHQNKVKFSVMFRLKMHITVCLLYSNCVHISFPTSDDHTLQTICGSTSENNLPSSIFDPTAPNAFEPPSYASLPKDPPKYEEIYSSGQDNTAFTAETSPSGASGPSTSCATPSTPGDTSGWERIVVSPLEGAAAAEPTRGSSNVNNPVDPSEPPPPYTIREDLHVRAAMRIQVRVGSRSNSTTNTDLSSATVTVPPGGQANTAVNIPNDQ